MKRDGSRPQGGDEFAGCCTSARSPLTGVQVEVMRFFVTPLMFLTLLLPGLGLAENRVEAPNKEYSVALPDGLQVGKAGRQKNAVVVEFPDYRARVQFEYPSKVKLEEAVEQAVEVYHGKVLGKSSKKIGSYKFDVYEIRVSGSSSFHYGTTVRKGKELRAIMSFTTIGGKKYSGEDHRLLEKVLASFKLE